ncbi:MAG TPA: FtsX-like permease family protein [Bacteriovoracaceae bacterium]|nr:FtsX-like permease family protein [Bacteriovoracaceae bacterium]
MIFKFFTIKEFKKFWPFYGLVVFTVLLGTLGLSGISLISSKVQGELNARAKELLTSDFALNARRNFTEEELKFIEDLKERSEASYKVVDIYSMLTLERTKDTRLVEVRGIEEGFPFHGSIQASEPLTATGLYISEDLERLWGVTKGDTVLLGELSFQVKDIIRKDSSVGLRGFSLAPRIYLPLKDLEKTGLLKFGATGSYAYHFLFPRYTKTHLENLKKEVFRKFTDPALRVSLPENSSGQTARAVNMLTNFMSLAALIGLILSLVGIFYLYQSHFAARLKDYCLLYLHGLSKIKLITWLILQFTVLFTFVMIIQVSFFSTGYHWIRPLLESNLGLDLGESISLDVLVFQIPFLYALSVLILVPLLLGLLRTPMGISLKSSKIVMGQFRYYDFLPFIVCLWFFSWSLSGSLRIGNIFFGGLLLVFLVSSLIVKVWQWSILKVLSPKHLRFFSLELGVALRQIARSGHKLTFSFLSLCLGATLISLILQLDIKVQSEFELKEEKPALFIFDIQEEQIEDLLKIAEDLKTPLEAVTPMIRARLETVNNRPFERKKRDIKLREEGDEEARIRNNALNLTSRDFLSPSERIIKGKDFKEINTDKALVSLESRWAQRMNIKIGDELKFDIQGVEFEATVVNLKEIKWTSFYPNFFVNVSPPHLEGAPRTYLAILPQTYSELKNDFQRAVLRKLPNISFIDVENLIEQIWRLFLKSKVAIELISILSLFVGLVILYGLCHDQVYRRYYDLALFKGLGMTTGQVRKSLLLEFGLLFLISIITGLLLGWFMAQVISQEAFKLSWSISVERLVIPGVILIILCLATIVVSSYRALKGQARDLLSEN